MTQKNRQLNLHKRKTLTAKIQITMNAAKKTHNNN